MIFNMVTMKMERANHWPEFTTEIIESFTFPLTNPIGSESVFGKYRLMVNTSGFKIVG